MLYSFHGFILCFILDAQDLLYIEAWNAKSSWIFQIEALR